jgi:hypothetical protein
VIFRNWRLFAPVGRAVGTMLAPRRPARASPQVTALARLNKFSGAEEAFADVEAGSAARESAVAA